jgi:hypothetical protein
MSKFDDIKIPENLKEETRKTIQKGRLLKRKEKHKHLKVASIIILSIGICMGTFNSSLADNIPFLNNIFKEINFPKGEKDDYTKYAQGINLTKTVGDNSLTINEVVCDGHKIYFTYTIHSKKKLPRMDKGFFKGYLNFDSKVSIKNGEAIKSSEMQGTYKDDYTYIFMDEYKLSFNGKKAPKVIKIDFLVKNIYTYNDNQEVVDTIKGPFHFKLKISPNGNTRVIDVDESKDGFTLDSIELGVYSTSVNIRFPEKFISDNNKKASKVSVSSQYIPEFSIEIFEKSMENNNYKVKNGIVYDSVVDENIYKIGYHDVNEFLTIRFENFKNQKNDEVTEIKVNISKYK